MLNPILKSSGRRAVQYLSGPFDPSVSGIDAARPALYARTSEYQFKSLAKLNEVLAKWGAVANHAWSFQAVSGVESDLATDSAIALTNNLSNGVDVPPTQHVATSLTDYVTDYGFTCADASLSRMAAQSNSLLTIAAAASRWFYLRLKFNANASGSEHSVIGKSQTAQAKYWALNVQTNGKILLGIFDGVTAKGVQSPSTHVTGAYVDVLGVIDRASASELAALCSNVEDAGTVDITAVTGALDGTDHAFGIGWVREYAVSANITVSFAALGDVPGTLVANRVAAVAALKSAMDSPAQLWTKYGDTANTQWQKVGP